MNLDSEKVENYKKEILSDFNRIKGIEEQITELNVEKKELVEGLCSLVGTEKKVISTIYKMWKESEGELLTDMVQIFDLISTKIE
jgi:negative regulator of sigma E activity